MLLLAAAVAVLAQPATPAQPPGLRLDGTFVQYQPWMLRLTRKQWLADLDAMRRAGLRVVVVQWLQHGKQSYVPMSGGELDLTGELLRYADRHGWKVHLGLTADDEWWRRPRDQALLERTSERCLRVARIAWRRYGRHRSFAGWYVSPEIWGGPYDREHLDRLRGFFRAISDGCKRLSGPLPVSIAPFYTTAASASVVRENITRILDGAGVDRVMVQDGVGARGWDDRLEDVVPEYLEAFRDACLAVGAEMWVVIESFRRRATGGTGFVPASGARLFRQMAAAAPHARSMVTFDFFHYMSPSRGAEQRKLFEFYVRDAVRKQWRPVLGPSVQVDPGFAYYRDRSPESIAAEIRAAGYSVVRLVVTADSKISRPLIDAFHRERMGVWYTTFGNGSYTVTDLPDGWERWRMVTRSDLNGKPMADGYHRLCLNNPEYRAWKKRQIAHVARAYPFDGIELVEPHWPEYPGPTAPAYGCFCEACVTAFRARYPEEESLPDVVDPASHRSPDRAPGLWRKWLDFRRRTLTNFLHDIVNGSGGVREAAGGRPVCVWTLALGEQDGVRKVLEIHGEDAGDVAGTVRPDVYGLQTHWPDWIRADLPGDYPRLYRLFVEQVLRAAPGTEVLIQADIGSQRQNRRDRAWIREFERASRQSGARSTTLYEYFIGEDIYSKPPRIAEIQPGRHSLVLRFTKRLDPTTARDLSRYTLSDGSVTGARVDGSVVRLAVSGLPANRVVTLSVRSVRDDPARRLFDDRPARVLTEQAVRFCVGARAASDRQR